MCAERPERRGKPGIQDIIVLTQLRIGRQLVFLPNLIFTTADIKIVVAVVPGRYAMAPPELPADTPVLNVVHPLVVRLGPVIRHEPDFAVLDGFDRHFGERFDIDVPLIRQIRFDDCRAAITSRYLGYVVFDFFDQAERLQIFDNFGSCLESVEPAIRLRRRVIDSGIVVKNIVLRQVVALADLIIIEIMRSSARPRRK